MEKPKVDQKGLEALTGQPTPIETSSPKEESAANADAEAMRTPITEELLQNLVIKYTNIFMDRYPEIQLRVFRSWTGVPPMDDVPEDLRPLITGGAAMVSGMFFNVGGDYRIGINRNYLRSAQLMTFFHEYGHACYKRESNEMIDNPHALLRTETAALMSSLRLADAEGLPEIAYMAVEGARTVAATDSLYRAAIANVETDPLWEKYSERPSN